MSAFDTVNINKNKSKLLKFEIFNDDFQIAFFYVGGEKIRVWLIHFKMDLKKFIFLFSARFLSFWTDVLC